MNIGTLHKKLSKFILEHPQCLKQPVMVKKLDGDDNSWEEVTFISDTVVESCPQYDSPLYFHSDSREKISQNYDEKIKKNDSLDEFETSL